jgi:hypothetical protein
VEKILFISAPIVPEMRGGVYYGQEKSEKESSQEKSEEITSKKTTPARNWALFFYL